MNGYDLLARRLHLAVIRLLEECISQKWVPGETKRILEAEVYSAARDAARLEGVSMDAAYAQASFALWVLVIDHPTLGSTPFRDMP